MFFVKGSSKICSGGGWKQACTGLMTILSIFWDHTMIPSICFALAASVFRILIHLNLVHERRMDEVIKKELARACMLGDLQTMIYLFEMYLDEFCSISQDIIDQDVGFEFGVVSKFRYYLFHRVMSNVVV